MPLSPLFCLRMFSTSKHEEQRTQGRKLSSLGDRVGEALPAVTFFYNFLNFVPSEFITSSKNKYNYIKNALGLVRGSGKGTCPKEGLSQCLLESHREAPQMCPWHWSVYTDLNPLPHCPGGCCWYFQGTKTFLCWFLSWRNGANWPPFNWPD